LRARQPVSSISSRFCRLERRLAGIEPAGGQLPKISLGGQAVLAHQQDALLAIDRHHHGAADVAHHAAFDLEAFLGIDGAVFGDAEQHALVHLLGGNDFHGLVFQCVSELSGVARNS